MRNAFAEEAVTLASEDEQYFLLSGDIGNRLFNTYKERFSERFMNCGVAEANMTGVAAGMAMAGLRPMTYTIAACNLAAVHQAQGAPEAAGRLGVRPATAGTKTCAS